MIGSNVSIDGIGALEAALSKGLGLDGYEYIMENVWKTDVSKDKDFQRRYNYFYKVRRNQDWRDGFYRVFEESKGRCDEVTFEDILRDIYGFSKTIEASFSSKMLATINPNHPIWDSQALKILGIKVIGKSAQEKLDFIISAYDEMERWYADYLKTENAKENIKVWDRMLPHHRGLSPVKKIDYMLWTLGGDK